MVRIVRYPFDPHLDKKPPASLRLDTCDFVQGIAEVRPFFEARDSADPCVSEHPLFADTSH